MRPHLTLPLLQEVQWKRAHRTLTRLPLTTTPTLPSPQAALGQLAPATPSFSTPQAHADAFQLSEAESAGPLWNDIEVEYNHLNPDVPFDDPYASGIDETFEHQEVAFALPPGSSTDPLHAAWLPCPPPIDPFDDPFAVDDIPS